MPSPLAGLYDVIHGGIHSEKQLARVLATNPVVAKHYANFDLSKFRLVRLRRNKEAYVSYLLGGHIYWTSKKVRLFAGETLVTDGTHYARARCGNRISEVPRQPISPWQPPLTAISGVLPPTLVLPKLPPLSTPSVQPLPIGTATGAPGDGAFFPFFFPVGGGSGGFDGHSTPDAPVPVPEPPTFILLASGLMILLLIRQVIRWPKFRQGSPNKTRRG